MRGGHLIEFFIDATQTEFRDLVLRNMDRLVGRTLTPRKVTVAAAPSLVDILSERFPSFHVIPQDTCPFSDRYEWVVSAHKAGNHALVWNALADFPLGLDCILLDLSTAMPEAGTLSPVVGSKTACPIRIDELAQAAGGYSTSSELSDTLARLCRPGFNEALFFAPFHSAARFHDVMRPRPDFAEMGIFDQWHDAQSASFENILIPVLVALPPGRVLRTVAPWFADGAVIIGSPDAAEQFSIEAFRAQPAPVADENPAVPMLRYSRSRPTTLHIIHSWGGGSSDWVSLYCQSDTNRNLILSSCSGGGRSGDVFTLAEPGVDGSMRQYPLSSPIHQVTASHPAYKRMLDDIIREYDVSRLMVSSVIGHSLQCLFTDLPTLVVMHDFFPTCIGLNLTFDGQCGSCDRDRLAACLERNPFSGNFRGIHADFWNSIRTQWGHGLARQNVRPVAPTAFVRDAVDNFYPGMAAKTDVIAHAPHIAKCNLAADLEDGRRPQILILGAMVPHKGSLLLDKILDYLGDTADVHLLGCYKGALTHFAERPNVHMLERYQQEDLPTLVGNIRPHFAMSLSVVPETFSFTLSELQQMSLPVLAVDMGAIGQRVKASAAGLALPPSAEAFIGAIRRFQSHPGELRALARVAAELVNPTEEEMIREYQQSFVKVGGVLPHSFQSPLRLELCQASKENLRARRAAMLHDAVSVAETGVQNA